MNGSKYTQTNSVERTHQTHALPPSLVVYQIKTGGDARFEALAGQGNTQNHSRAACSQMVRRPMAYHDDSFLLMLGCLAEGFSSQSIGFVIKSTPLPFGQVPSTRAKTLRSRAVGGHLKDPSLLRGIFPSERTNERRNARSDRGRIFA